MASRQQILSRHWLSFFLQHLTSQLTADLAQVHQDIHRFEFRVEEQINSSSTAPKSNSSASGSIYHVHESPAPAYPHIDQFDKKGCAILGRTMFSPLIDFTLSISDSSIRCLSNLGKKEWVFVDEETSTWSDFSR
ncbi:hypothetical protein NOF04DRAFT_1271681 [Fusarium oxysporum II5]|nr:hypothetical protein NOF04DRAFT_1271681 [Fusarium oxysporum II5]